MVENGELTIRKANTFVQEYKVSLSLAEIRIVNYLIANIESPKYDEKFRKFKFSIKEFCKIVYPDKKQGDAYRWLPKVIKDLSDKSAWKEVPSTENPGKMKKVLLRWIERPEFEEGFVTLELNPYLAPYLLQLDSSYFQSKFKYTIESKSKYTIPLYELLKSWEKVSSRKKTFEIMELRSYMDAMDKSKDNSSEFKRKALDPAVKEINEITDLFVEYKEIKRGRKVTHIEFTILQKADKNIPYESETDEEYVIPSDCQEVEEQSHSDEIHQKLQERLDLWSGACNNEFDSKKIMELATLARPHIITGEGSITLANYDLLMYDFIYAKYISLNAKPDVKNRYAFLKDMVKNNYN